MLANTFLTSIFDWRISSKFTTFLTKLSYDVDHFNELLLLFALNQFAEILGGYLAGSLAIMSDAAHLLSDCISFIVALLAIVWAKKSPNNHMTFGYKRIGMFQYIFWNASTLLHSNIYSMSIFCLLVFIWNLTEVLGAIMSIFGIWLLTTFLFYFAFNRLMYQDFDIDADTMMIVSALGIVINIMYVLFIHFVFTRTLAWLYFKCLFT